MAQLREVSPTAAGISRTKPELIRNIVNQHVTGRLGFESMRQEKLAGVRTPTGKATLADIHARLAAATSREEGTAALQGLTMAQLREVSPTAAGISRTKPELIRNIVNLHVGGRLEHEAIQQTRPTFTQLPTGKATLADIRDATSRADAEALLKPHTKAELQDIARHAGVPFTTRATKATLVSAILDEVGHGDRADVGPHIEVANSIHDLTPIQIGRGEHLTPAGREALDSLGPEGHPLLTQISDPEAKIREAYRMLAMPGGGHDNYVALADIRKLIGDQASRSEVDAALTRLSRGSDVHLTPQSYARGNADTRIPAALKLGGRELDQISIDDPALARPRQFAAVDMADELDARRSGGTRDPMMALLSDAELQAEIDRRVANDPMVARDMAARRPAAAVTPPTQVEVIGALSASNLTSTKLRKFAADLGIDVPPDMRAKSSIQIFLGDYGSHPGMAEALASLPKPKQPKRNFDAIAERIAGKPEAEIYQAIQDLNVTELRMLARKFPGGIGTNFYGKEGPSRSMQIPAGLTLDEARRWLAQRVSGRLERVARVRPSGLPTNRRPAAGDFQDLAERISGKSEAQILEITQDLNATELARLARQFPGDAMLRPSLNMTSERTQGLKLPGDLTTAEEKRRWLAKYLSSHHGGSWR